MTKEEIEAQCQAFAKNLGLTLTSEPHYALVENEAFHAWRGGENEDCDLEVSAEPDGSRLTMRSDLKDGEYFESTLIMTTEMEADADGILNTWLPSVERSVRKLRDGGQL